MKKRTNWTIRLPYDNNNSFKTSVLDKYLKKEGFEFIVNGQQHDSLKSHRKKRSFDYWLRENVAVNKNTAQAVNSVLDQLIKTGRYKIETNKCPESGRVCKCLRLIEC